MPLPYRWLTALMMRYNGSSILIDCGEGTQIAMKEAGFSPNPIDVMCFTHYHADHISGLPGMLLSMGNSDRTDPLLMIGPKGLTRVVNSLRVIAPELPFEINFRELSEQEEEIQMEGYRLKAFRANHNVTCYGYSIYIDRVGKFSVDAARAADIPLKFWNPLQKGETIKYEDRTFTPDMVLGPDRKGIKLTYCTDSRPTDLIVSNAKDSDLFICEGMYGEPDMDDKARDHKHMTFYEAARMARQAEVKELWLTHYSPSLSYPKNYEGTVRKIFENTHVAKDGRSVTLKFTEE